MTPLDQFRTLVISGERPGPRLVVVAGVHGDEYEPMAAVEELSRSISPADLAGTLVLVPVANVDAFLRNSRCGQDGRDLARTCPGSNAGTPTERVAASLSELIRSATHFIDLHTGGAALALVPLAGYMLHPDRSVLDIQREMARAFGLPYIWGTSSAFEGRTLSVARDAGIPGIYVEHGGGVLFNTLAVNQMVQGCLNVAKLLGMLEGAITMPAAQIVVEDNRPGSGHLQVQNAAPISGLFFASVALGDTVVAGQSLGYIRSPLTGECVAAPADNAGILFMLRLIAAVKAGDALAAIVDTKVNHG